MICFGRNDVCDILGVKSVQIPRFAQYDQTAVSSGIRKRQRVKKKLLFFFIQFDTVVDF